MPEKASPDLPARLLVIDRERELADIVATQPAIFAPLHATDGRAAAAALTAGRYDVILVDLDSLADISGDTTHAVARLARLGGPALIIAISPNDSVSAAVAVLQAGAHDCLVRPISIEDLSARIAVLRARHDRRGTAQPVTRTPLIEPGRLIARSPQMKVLREQLARIANSPAPVFLTGESGTGKRLAAETLHAFGPHADLPFVAVDCAGAGRIHVSVHDDPLLQLAGPEATRALIRAGGGTLYLDEICGLGSAAQSQLMALIEPDGKGLAAAGYGAPIVLRIVSSTCRSPLALIAEHGLRQDLFYRLNVLPLNLPPLRQRPEDIAPLAGHFLKRFARTAGKPLQGFTPGARAYLEAHEWKGNVRQLENLVSRTVAMFDGTSVTPQMLAAADIEGLAGGTRPATVLPVGEDDIRPMWQQEQQIIEAAIARHHGNIARAAAALEISPSTIYRKKQAWEERQNGIAGAA